MEIKNSLEWSVIEDRLRKKSHGLTHERQIRKMIENLKSDVTELSKSEVLERRTQRKITEPLLNKINENIQMIEEYILVAALIG